MTTITLASHTTHMNVSLFQLFKNAAALNKVARKDFKSDKEHIRARNAASEARRMVSSLMNAMAFGAVSDSGDTLGLDAWAQRVYLPEHADFDAVPESERTMAWLAQRLAAHLRRLHTLSLDGKYRLRAEGPLTYGPVAPVKPYDDTLPPLLPAQPPEANAAAFMALPKPGEMRSAVRLIEMRAEFQDLERRLRNVRNDVDSGNYDTDSDLEDLHDAEPNLLDEIETLNDAIAAAEASIPQAQIPFCLSQAELDADEFGRVDA